MAGVKGRSGRHAVVDSVEGWRHKHPGWLAYCLDLQLSIVRDENAPAQARLDATGKLQDRILGKSVVQVQADITSKVLVITPAELAAEIHRLQLAAHAVLQAQDTAIALPAGDTLEMANTLEQPV